jgi:hypothetical protein
MIIIRIPKDIREYKEKLIAGMTARNIVCVFLGVVLIAPLIYIAVQLNIPMDIMTWGIILIAVPIGLIGFYQPDNMPFEKFLISTIKFTFGKKQLVFISKNAYDTEKPPEKLSEKLVEKRSIERAIIFAEAKQSGENITLKECDRRLVSVKINQSNNSEPPDDKNKKKNKKSDKKEADLRAEADIIQAKRTVDPYYIFTKKEQNILRRVATQKEKKRLAEIKSKSKSIKRTNLISKKRRNIKTTLPKSTQDVIPYIADYNNGIFEVEKGVYSKLYLINDVNYATESEEKQIEIFATYAEFLNAYDESTNISIYVDNRIVSKNEQQHRIFYQMADDKLDDHRTEYNRIMQMQMELGRNEMVQEKYISVTIEADTLGEAISRLQKIDDVVEKGMARIGTTAKALTTNERLEVLHDKFRKGREGDFKIDFDFIESQGISSKDYIAPASIFFERKHFMIDDEYYRVMYLNNLPTELGDYFFPEFVDNNFPLTATINVVPLMQSDAIKKVDKQRAGMEANILQAQKRAGRQGYSANLAIHRKLKEAYEDSEELSDDLTRKGQKMFYVTLMIMFSAPTLEELDKRAESLDIKARRITAQLQILTCRQLEGLRCCLPMGVPAKLGIDRALTSESTATFIPFSSQEISQRDGFYYGLNSVSRNLIMLNRTKLRTPSGFILGTSGSGKSFAVKREMLNVLLKDKVTTLLIIDPENEYTDFVRNFGGEVINISTDSDHHINPMEMSADYGLDDEDTDISLEQKKEKALRKKSDYIMSLVNSMLTTGEGNTLKPQQKTFIDKCVKRCYAKYLEHDFDLQYLPTLKDLQNEFDKNKDHSEEARLVAEGTGYYTKGSMDTFAHLSNVNLNNRIVSFSIRDLGEQLMQIALLIILDFIWNKMCDNSEKNVRTYCYADEIHVLFKNKDSAEFLRQLYKRGRKYGLVITGITQNIEDLLKSDTGRGMVSNSEFLMLLRQAHEDIKILAPMLRISENQCLDLERADVGSGILKAGTAVVPFRDRFPQESYLYRLMSTNFNERVTADVKK